MGRERVEGREGEKKRRRESSTYVFIAIPRTLGRRPRFLFRPAFPRFRCPWYLLQEERTNAKSARASVKSNRIETRPALPLSSLRNEVKTENSLGSLPNRTRRQTRDPPNFSTLQLHMRDLQPIQPNLLMSNHLP